MAPRISTGSLGLHATRMECPMIFSYEPSRELRQATRRRMDLELRQERESVRLLAAIAHTATPAKLGERTWYMVPGKTRLVASV